MSRVLIRETGEYVHPEYRIIYFNGYLPYPPSINHYWKLGKNGRRFICPEGKQYLSMISILMHREFDGFYLHQFDIIPDNAELSVFMTFYLPDNRGRDLDNVPKCIFDCFQKCEIWKNDKQVCELFSRKRRPDPRFPDGAVFIECAELDD